MNTSSLRNLAIAFAAFTVGCVDASARPLPPQLECAQRWGKPGEPLVKNADTAKAIFLAVERDFAPQADLRSFPDLAIEDEGNAWSVGRWRAPKKGANGNIEITFGGGQLSLRIAKCDARISDVHYSR